MGQVFVPGTANMAFSGEMLFAQDASTLGTVYSFGSKKIVLTRNANIAYPDLIDGSAFPVNSVAGVNLGQIQVSGVVQPDRGWHTFINSAFGLRGTPNGPSGGQLYPWVINIVPNSGASVIGATGVWWHGLKIQSEFSVGGSQQMVTYVLTGIVLDPNDVEGAPALTVPSYVGTPGHGIAPFSRSSVTNDSTTTYDEIRSIQMSVSNQLQVIPSIKDTANRIASGCVPGAVSGALSLTQLRGASNAIPQANGVYPIDIVMPTGDAAHTLTVAGSWNYDSQNQNYAPTEFVDADAEYTLFSTSTGATATAAWPITASYA